MVVGTVTMELDLWLRDSGSGREKHTDVVHGAGFLMEQLALFIEENFQYDDAQVLVMRLLSEDGEVAVQRELAANS